ncbi:hypothetical protein BDV39DRAFT_191192 [Aspergillus sergii]|uniref:BHLH domain-containing protein n=1 Tax=Aspergillus sergii TaxID=1034303 RepID=A0A5N6XB28_9EURO|nr:hypothetical protein BDV39DRAFT_191192 [Aspergillus sergii]
MSEINPGLDLSNSYGTILCILDTCRAHSETTRVYLKLLNPLLTVRYPQLRRSNQRKMPATSAHPWKLQSQDIPYVWDNLIGVDADVASMSAFDTIIEPPPANSHRRPSSQDTLDSPCYLPQWSPSSADLLPWEAYENWTSPRHSFAAPNQFEDAPVLPPLKQDSIQNTSKLSSRTRTSPRQSHCSASSSTIASLSPPPSSPSGSPSSTPHEGPAHPSSRRSAHNRIEKRYRENLSKNFTALESSLQGYYTRGVGSGRPRFYCQRKHASKKMAVLTDAVNYIGELEAETVMLKKKLETLRQALLPNGIWRYTLNDD